MQLNEIDRGFIKLPLNSVRLELHHFLIWGTIEVVSWLLAHLCIWEFIWWMFITRRMQAN